MADGTAQPGASLHLQKLCVGADTIEDLAAWQASRAAQRAPGTDARPVHVTRMWPRRAGELLAGGSLFWVIRGSMCVRQRIAALEPVTDGDGVRRCAIVLDPRLIRVVARPRKPFQGWRYLAAADAPADIGPFGATEDGSLPPDLAATLAELGLVER